MESLVRLQLFPSVEHVVANMLLRTCCYDEETQIAFSGACVCFESEKEFGE